MMPAAQTLQALIANVRRRWFASVALEAIALGAVAAAAPVLLAGIVYWTLAPRGGALLLLAAAAVAILLIGVVAVAWRIERRPDDHRVARFIEERVEAQPGALPMNDCLVSAVQALSIPSNDPRGAFAALVLGAAARCIEGVTPATVIPSARLRRDGALAAGGVLALVVALVLASPALSHVVQTARLRLLPQSVVVDVLPGDVRVPAGQPLRIRARIQANGDDLSRLQPKLVVASGGEQRVVNMVPGPDGFEFAFASIDRTFQYKVTAASIASSEYTVTALFPPRVKRIALHYQYPSFSGLAARSEEDGGDIYAPAGTRIRMEIEADKPLASGELTLGGQATSLAPRSNENVVSAELVLSKDDSYRIRLTDRDGLRSEGDSEYFIRLMDDRPPDIRIVRPAADQGITPLEEVAIEARAEDDYGVAKLDLVFSVSGGKEVVVPFSKVEGGALQKTGQHLLAAEDLKVRPGDVITYYARARDVGRGKRSTETKTDMFFLEVHPFNAEYEQAQSQAGAGGAAGDPQLESMIAAQKEIISATWNIERRSGAGRSDADIKSVAAAQAELKARVERVLGAARGRRGREFLPQRIAQQPSQSRPAAGDPVANAAEAMSRAIEQLSAAKTRDAITHEMTALNNLLQAQAEVRRRQVMQQQANGGGRGGNRQTQDLSALFDKELQRQQRTNYEQRSQVETREEQQQEGTDQAALDRIRDLARRQEELNRRQRELAAMSAEERQRQLEKLTRDQQELQRQAEELSRQLNQPQQQAGQQQSGQQQSGQQQSGQQQSGQQQSGQQQSGQQQSGQPSGQQQSEQQRQLGNPAVRDAVEQMRQAAGEMQRADADAAARRGERAVEQLRRAEQQMRGGSGDARQRAAADLQAEAQQIAQEQQRIAAEAGRLEKGEATTTEDARRRLAADKDRLADRVEALQRDARQLGEPGGKSPEQARAREAAAQLERDRIEARMREGADGMRKGGPPSQGAEQQVARSLEQVVEKLGGASSAQARQMAGQLEQSSRIREQLDKLEAQMKEAQAGGKTGESEKLREQYQQALRDAKESLGRQAGAEQRDGQGRSTPEEHEFSRSAPGTEAFKQDRAEWASLRRDVERALEARDAAATRRLAQALAEDKLSAGGSERVPEQYRRLVAKYYESLAKTRK